MSGYRYTNLTSAIADKLSPLRRYLDAEFPHIARLQAAFRTPPRPLLVPGGGADPATLGAAFDLVVRMVLDPDHIPAIALAGFRGVDAAVAVVLDVVRVAHDNADCRHGPAPTALLRAGWALALCTEAYRIGLVPGSAIWRLLDRQEFTGKTLLRMAPPRALDQMRELHAVAVDRLYPRLPDPAGRVALGPTFDASRRCAADADVIVDGLLLELKTRLGTLNKRTAARSDSLSRADIYQLLAYVLFDYSDTFAVNQVGLYSARYGTLAHWPLTTFLAELSGHEVDIAVERERVWALLHQ